MESGNEKSIWELCERVKQIAFDLNAYLGYRHLEKGYENGSVRRFRKSGLRIYEPFPR
jgi:hypothetical protein